MQNRENFYIELMNVEDSCKEKKEAAKQTILMKLIQDTYRGFESEPLMKKVFDFCEIDKHTWESYMFAYSSYKKYTNSSNQHSYKTG